MKKASDIFEKMRRYLHSEEFLNQNRLSIKAFKRKRVLHFSVIFSFIFNRLTKSIPKEQIIFCKICNIDARFSRAGVTKARAKVSPNAFAEMNQVLLKEFYTDISFKKFHNFITMAVDGSTIALPLNSQEIKNKYGCATNGKVEVPLARVSTFYDVINGITWDAIMAPYAIGERELAIQHFEKMKALKMDLTNILAIFDRGYPSLALAVYLLKNNVNFLMRCNSQFLKEVNEIGQSQKKDVVLEISLKRATRAAKAELKELVPNINLDEKISIRVVVVTLSTGEKEVLITSLLNKEQSPYKIFKELYFKRWGVEENYKFLKVVLELENFSAKTCIGIEQDFHSTVLVSNVQAVLALEANEEIIENNRILPGRKPKKYVYKINGSVARESLKNDFVAAMLNPEICLNQFCINVKKVMKQHSIPIRPGRSFKRVRRHPHRRFHMNLR